MTTNAKKLEIAERRLQAIDLRRSGFTWKQIAERLELGNPGVVAREIMFALQEANREVQEQLDGYRYLELEKLDALERLMWATIRKKHLLAQHGRIIFDPETGEPMTDDGPLFNATDRLLKIAERRAKLMGWDAPAKVEVRATDELDNEIAGLLAQLAARGEGVPARAALEAGGADDGGTGDDGVDE